MTVTIYHNPRCSKSRQTLALLEEHKAMPQVIEYLKTPPSAAELERILSLLHKEPLELMRKGEEVFTTLGLGDGSKSRSELVQIMVDNPILIERPIVVHGAKAAIGRPPESVLEIL